jgi:uncharacterized protein YprB with RNaseH-like and TPR domain
MDRSQLAARIQEILKGRPVPPKPAELHAPGTEEQGPEVHATGERQAVVEPQDEEAAFAARCAADEAGSRVLEVLGATLEQGPGGPCLVVDRWYEGHRAHGRRRLAEYAAAMAAAAEGMNLLTPAAPGTPMFFDLETTGLSGGAGTYAFLVGCGCFDGDSFHTRQFFLRGFGGERALLHAVTAFLHSRDTRDPLAAASRSLPATPGTRDPLPTVHCPPPTAHCPPPPALRPPPTLVTYNGKSFDLPLIETRYLMHRLASPFAGLPHLDLLFPARRLWRRRLARDGSNRRALMAGGVPADDRASCALTVLEEDILGLMREDDVPGWEIPGRYFAYARTGDARGLEAVLEHNRLDLVSLGALSALVLEIVTGRVPARDRFESLALGRLFEFLGRLPDAERCYTCAAEPDGLFEAALDGAARAEALHWLAIHHRRARRFAQAAQTWQQMLEINGLEPELRREGLEALAIHAEHRAKDIGAARRFALGALDVSRGSRHAPEVEHRLGRLQRKMSSQPPRAAAGLGPMQPPLPAER